MRPRIVSDRFPYITLYLTVHTKTTAIVQLKLDALVDTGFTSDVALPEKYLPDLPRTPDAYASFRLADGSNRITPVYLGSMLLPGFADEDGDHKSFPVTVVVMGDEPLVGRGLTDRFLLTLDHGRRVVLEP